MQTCLRIACLATILASPAAVHAQGSPDVVLRDPSPPHWDVSGHVAWLTVDKGDIAPQWNRWYDVATFGASAGRFFGPHVKIEADVATSAWADVYVEHSFITAAQPYPIYYAQPERFRMTTLSGGLSYQFLNNRWFHPVVGAGFESARETRVVESFTVGGPPPAGAAIDPPGTTVSWENRPFAHVGAKFFVSERGFIRSDVRTTFGGHGVAQVSWRTGFGMEF